MNNCILYRNYFEILYKEIIEKFRRTVEEEGKIYPSKVKQLYGYNDNLDKYNESLPNLRNYIIADKKVQEFYKEDERFPTTFRGKYLYERYLEKKRSKITFTYSPYNHIFFLYAGYKDVRDFVNKHKSEKNYKNQKVLLFGGNITEPTDDANQYICYYYSYKFHSIKTFKLWIDFEIQPKKFKHNEFLAKETGLHDASGVAKPSSNIYIGKAKEKSGFLYINLINENKDRVDELNIIATIGNRPAQTKKFFSGSYQGVSIDAFIINAACLIVEKKWHDALSSMDIELMGRYLHMQRKNFRVRTFDGDNLTALKIKNRYPVNRINNLVGHYRVWNQDRNGNIIQSKFVIESNYESWLMSIITEPLDTEIEGFQKQVCLLNIHDDYVRKLFVSSHLKVRTGITNYAIIDIPVRQRKYLKGVFCTIGFDKYSPAIGTDIVLMRDKDDFEIKQFIKKDILKMIESDERLKKMYRILTKYPQI